MHFRTCNVYGIFINQVNIRLKRDRILFIFFGIRKGGLSKSVGEGCPVFLQLLLY